MTEAVARPPLIDLLRVREAAAELRMSEDMLYRLVRERAIQHRRIRGIGICFTPDDLKAYVDSGLQTAADRPRRTRTKRAA